MPIPPEYARISGDGQWWLMIRKRGCKPITGHFRLDIAQHGQLGFFIQHRMKALIHILCPWGDTTTSQEVGMTCDEKESSYHRSRKRASGGGDNMIVGLSSHSFIFFLTD